MNDQEPKFDDQRVRYSGDTLESSRASTGVIISFAFKIILLVVIGIPVIQFLFNGRVNIFDLNSIMQVFETAPAIDMSWFSKLVNTGIPGLSEEWAILDGFRQFLNYLSQGVLFLAWLVTGVVNCIVFFSHFIITMMTA